MSEATEQAAEGPERAAADPSEADQTPVVPLGFFKELPDRLPDNEPYYYLSAAQKGICARNGLLRAYSSHLPGWVPHRRIADAMGHSHSGIEAALKRLGGQPYVWATEFENVHTHWEFREKPFEVDDVVYYGSEDFFHRQKPKPFDKELWDGRGPGEGLRDKAMRLAVSKKFERKELAQMLRITYPHPLLSIKGDAYWGVLPSGKGENMLAKILMELRNDLLHADATADAYGDIETMPVVR